MWSASVYHTRAWRTSAAGTLATGNRFRANTEFSAVFDSEFMELNVTDWIEGKKKKLKPAKVCPTLLLTEEKQQMTFFLFFFPFLALRRRSHSRLC